MSFIQKILGYRAARAARIQSEVSYIKILLEEARRLMSKGETEEENCRRAMLAKKVEGLAESEGIPLKKIGTDVEEIFKLKCYYASKRTKQVAKNSQ